MLTPPGCRVSNPTGVSDTDSIFSFDSRITVLPSITFKEVGWSVSEYLHHPSSPTYFSSISSLLKLENHTNESSRDN